MAMLRPREQPPMTPAAPKKTALIVGGCFDRAVTGRSSLLTARGICSYSVLMSSERKGVLPVMLSEAVRARALLRLRCICSRVCWYHPVDMIRLYGDIPALNLERRMRCEACRANPYVEITSPTAEELQTIKLRRLDRVWWERRVTWREG